LSESGGRPEFTGERILPGIVEDALFNEHFARYRFAARFAQRLGEDISVLDDGCGAGYGAVEFSARARVTGVDISPDAIAYARQNFGLPNIKFLQAACESLPFADGAFDMIVAFEVIEHLERWREMLCEARRCLKPAGVLLVSTPNKAYYAEFRAAAGPNPFHVHEFGYEEFSAALADFFPHVRIWCQNRAEAIALLPAASPGGTQPDGAGTLDSGEDRDPVNAHFFLAACNLSPAAFAEPFAWLPKTGNLLRERDRHIALLNGEVEKKTAWLGELEEKHARLVRSHEAVNRELEERNKWAAQLNDEIRIKGERIEAMQSEIESIHAGYGAQVERLHDELTSVHAGYQHQIAELARQDASRLLWVADLEQQIARGQAQITRDVSEIDRLRREKESLEREKAAIFASPWFRLGRKLGLGPAGDGA
jgi:SAM-dependent methyltransferase